MQSTIATFLRECINECGEELTCKSVTFRSAAPDECNLQSDPDAATAAEPDPNHHYAYVVDPPIQPAINEDTVTCSTKCPTANDQSYASIFGNSFRINCQKRHGTSYIKKDIFASLKDCMDACAPSRPCSSVDYHDSSQMCYFSNHHGEPTINTPGFSSAYSLGCTGACSGGCGCCQSGNGTLPTCDDVTFLWVGPNAYAGYTHANANLSQPCVAGGGGTARTYKVSLVRGQYYPIRIMWVNGGGAGNFGFSLKAPDGKVIISERTTEPSPYLVKFSCDGTRAPRFAPFGSEK